MDQTGDWFSNWERVWAIVVASVFFYVFIIGFVRVLGKRTTGQMNNFDWLVTIIIGSLASSGILLDSVAIVDAAIAILALGGLQWLVTFVVLRSERFANIIKADPLLLVHKGRFLRDAMRSARISEEEIQGALRSRGLLELNRANWVILETNGELTVIERDALGEASTLTHTEVLKGVHRPDHILGSD